jgi:hypothetical protein
VNFLNRSFMKHTAYEIKSTHEIQSVVKSVVSQFFYT